MSIYITIYDFVCMHVYAYKRVASLHLHIVM